MSNTNNEIFKGLMNTFKIQNAMYVASRGKAIEKKATDPSYNTYKNKFVKNSAKQLQNTIKIIKNKYSDRLNEKTRKLMNLRNQTANYILSSSSGGRHLTRSSRNSKSRSRVHKSTRRGTRRRGHGRK